MNGTIKRDTSRLFTTVLITLLLVLTFGLQSVSAAAPTLSSEDVSPPSAPWGTTFTFEVTYYDQDDDLPGPNLDVILIMDRSGSMSGDKLNNAKKGAKSLVDKLKPNDRVSLISFSTDVTEDLDFTSLSQKPTIKSAIDDLTAGGRTSLWDAAWEGLDNINAEVRSGAKGVMVLLTDGKNNDSVKTYSELADYAVTSSVPVPFFSVGVGSQVDEAELKDLSSRTGGDYYNISGDKIPRALTEIGERITAPELYIDGTFFRTVSKNPADRDVTDGKAYKYEWDPTPDDIGRHYFSFYAEDNQGNSDSTSNRSGPTVTKRDSSTTAKYPLDTQAFGSTTVSGKLFPKTPIEDDLSFNNKRITLTFTKPDGSSFNRSVTSESDGSFSYQLSGSEVDYGGDWKVEASWGGDQAYNESTSSTKSFSVSKIDSSVSSSVPPSTQAKGQIIVSGTIDPPGKTVKLTFTKPNGSTFERSVSSSSTDGSFSYQLSSSELDVAGDWYVKAEWSGNQAYKESSSSLKSFSVTKIPTTLSISPSALSAEFYQSKEFVATLTDDEGNPVSDAMIEWNLQGSGSLSQSSTMTNYRGKARVTYQPSLWPGEAEVGAEYKGSSVYVFSPATAKAKSGWLFLILLITILAVITGIVSYAIYRTKSRRKGRKKHEAAAAETSEPSEKLEVEVPESREELEFKVREPGEENMLGSLEERHEKGEISDAVYRELKLKLGGEEGQ